MNIKNILNLSFLFFASVIIYGQDTINVQAFNYESTTRDSIIEFPTEDHNGYEKILMYYSMRCKDGLISTGADRNRGCGEWDYSCNTSIIDSNVVDSLLTKHPDYVIPGYSEDFFFYTSQPVFTYNLRDLVQTTVGSVNNEEDVTIGQEEIASNALFSNQNVQKSYLLIPYSDLQNFTNNTIGALAFDGITDSEEIQYFRIRLANTTEDSLSKIDLSSTVFETVFNDHLSAANQVSDKIYFNKDFTFIEDQNIILEISFTSDRNKNVVNAASNNVKDNMVYHQGNDAYVEFNNTTLDIPGDNLNTISDEITIALWIKGDENVLPASTSTIYGVDENGNRQVNLHLPWSNSRVYWDCGFEDGSYDRIDKLAEVTDFTKNWNHWAFTKNTVTGRMTILLNGEVWHTGTSKTNKINLSNLTIGASNTGGNSFTGGIDDVMVFDKELSVEEIKHLMTYRPDETDENYENLKLLIDFNSSSVTTATDQSNGGVIGTFKNSANKTLFRGESIFKDFSTSETHPNLILSSGNYSRTLTTQTITDSTQVFPREIIPYHVENGELIQDPSLFYWEASETYVYDQNGDVTETIDIDYEGVITFGTVEYYRKFPSKFELLSFVTPYGIGLDFGLEGKTWIFDVTDFGPVLKGNKRLVMDRGGQWQEDMDIQFKFIKGKPARNIQSIQQVWPVSSPGYASILANDIFEEREIKIEPQVKSMKLRLAVTGHGQEGEFIARTHSVNINGGAREIQWQVWKECAFNPIYPQGGTWVYDRAGWCPGAPTDLNEHEIMEYVEGDESFEIDYGVNTASGDSRYIVNAQLVKYGDSNFNNEVSLERIVSPTNYVEYERLNPVCKEPTIIIKNNGKEPLKTLTISYSVEGTEPMNFYWAGNLEFLETEEITLPSFGEGRWERGNKFNVTLSNPNGMTDENLNNNTLSSQYKNVPHLNGEIIIRFFTNLANNESKWYLRDEGGNVIASRTSGLTSATLYTDTIRNLDGCYTLQVTDSGQDGLSWWANNDGSGSFRIRDDEGIWETLQPDFGGEISYSFTSGVITSIKEPSLKQDLDVNIYPNPSTGQFFVEVEGGSEAKFKVLDYSGKEIMEFNKNLDSTYDEVIVDLSNSPDGMYFVTILVEDQLITKKIIKGM